MIKFSQIRTSIHANNNFKRNHRSRLPFSLASSAPFHQVFSNSERLLYLTIPISPKLRRRIIQSIPNQRIPRVREGSLGKGFPQEVIFKVPSGDSDDILAPHRRAPVKWFQVRLISRAVRRASYLGRETDNYRKLSS